MSFPPSLPWLIIALLCAYIFGLRHNKPRPAVVQIHQTPKETEEKTRLGCFGMLVVFFMLFLAVLFLGLLLSSYR